MARTGRCSGSDSSAEIALVCGAYSSLSSLRAERCFTQRISVQKSADACRCAAPALFSGARQQALPSHPLSVKGLTTARTTHWPTNQSLLKGISLLTMRTCKFSRRAHAAHVFTKYTKLRQIERPTGSGESHSLLGGAAPGGKRPPPAGVVELAFPAAPLQALSSLRDCTFFGLPCKTFAPRNRMATPFYARNTPRCQGSGAVAPLPSEHEAQSTIGAGGQRKLADQQAVVGGYNRADPPRPRCAKSTAPQAASEACLRRRRSSLATGKLRGRLSPSNTSRRFSGLVRDFAGSRRGASGHVPASWL